MKNQLFFFTYFLITCQIAVGQNNVNAPASLTDEKTNKEYLAADLATKLELNKKYAIAVLPILSSYQTSVEDKFAGVKNFGKLVAQTNFNEPQDISKMTNTNSNYWRALMEMEENNQLIPVTKIFMLTSQGEFDYAFKYIEIIRLFSGPKTIANEYLSELSKRLIAFNTQLNDEIEKGIEQHDKGNYKKAITIYTDILQRYPNSAWAKYELYYSKNALEDREMWDNDKIGIYKSNPLYNMDVRASNGKEGYLLLRRQSINMLFKTRENMLNDVAEYANIAMDLCIYDFAAQLFWLTNGYKIKETNVLYKYLYCLEKLGVTDLKEAFKGDMKKEFAAIEETKEKEMTESTTYNSFKK